MADRTADGEGYSVVNTGMVTSSGLGFGGDLADRIVEAAAGE